MRDSSSNSKKNGKRNKAGKVKNLMPLIPVSKKRQVAHFDTPICKLTSEQRCELIAELSESILENPEAAFTTNKSQLDNKETENGGNLANESVDDEKNQYAYLSSHSKMRRLLELANPDKNGSDEGTARLANLSMLAIFQDIIPTYRIRLPTAMELSVRVSKDIKKLRDYERALLTHYQQYLKLLETMWEKSCTLQHKSRYKLPPSALGVTAILCLCELLKSSPHFNFRSNILAVIVRQMNNNHVTEVSIACCQAISKIFESDAQGEISLEATRLISRMFKDRNRAVLPQVLRTFLSLPLRVHEDEAQAAKLAAIANARKRKKDEDAADLEKDMKEGDATVDKINLARNQSDTLHTVTLVYFRILKSVDGDSINRKTIDLLPPALEGLAKFGHLINFDTVVDLLNVLKVMLKKVDFLPLDVSLNCILTAFHTLQGPGKELQIDQKEYVMPLYSQLPRLVTHGNESRHTFLALKCLNAAFIRRREYSKVRIAAFVKQISTIALHLPPFTSTPLLAFVRQLLYRYSSVANQLLENELDVITSGEYTPNVDDPEKTNPFATSAWELATLKFHINPSVTTQTIGASTLKTILPTDDPFQIHSSMISNSSRFYVHHKMNKRKHPLFSGRNDKRKQKHQVRFIKPRQTANMHLTAL